MADVLKTQLFENLRKVINVVDELRDVGLQEFIQLPRIAVIGSQSAGKSSLLQNIVGLDFLPRGSGVVTRRPLELRMVHVPIMNGEIKPYAIFDAFNGQKFTNFDEVRTQIEELTDKVAGQNQGIVDDPITLTIFSNDCPDLTLIDLPGITRISMQGTDQQKVDIQKITTEMALRYGKDERTIILAVAAANQDLTTSDGLKLAMDADKGGMRTIGVITKIDIMDRGTDARSMLEGRDVALKLGYVGVRNRSQQDIIDKIRVRKALESEQQFFSKHPVYSTMNPQYLGTQALTQKLTTVLYQHIRECLPAISKEINEKISECEERLRDLGPALPRENKERMHMIWEMITMYTQQFKNQIKGKYDPQRTNTNQSEISGGAMVKLIFNDLYQGMSEKGYRASKDYSDQDIERAITLHQGDSIPGFPSIDAFLYLINPQLQKLKAPAQECLNDVYTYLENMSSQILKRIFERFPALLEEITELASKVLQTHRDIAKQMVDGVIISEQGYLFTNDLEYLTNKTHLIPATGKNEQPQQIDPQKIFVDELRSRVDTYFSLVVRNVRDTVPQVIGYFLVRDSQENLQYSIYNEIMKHEEMMKDLGEPIHITEERDTVSKTLNTLKKAMKVLKRDPDLSNLTGSRIEQNDSMIVSKKQ